MMHVQHTGLVIISRHDDYVARIVLLSAVTGFNVLKGELPLLSLKSRSSKALLIRN